jgi:hypothetical protein
VNDELRRRLEELAARGRTDSSLSSCEVIQHVRAIAERGWPDAPLSYEEVMHRVREIAARGDSNDDAESSK